MTLVKFVSFDPREGSRVHRGANIIRLREMAQRIGAWAEVFRHEARSGSAKPTCLRRAAERLGYSMFRHEARSGSAKPTCLRRAAERLGYSIEMISRAEEIDGKRVRVYYARVLALPDENHQGRAK